MKKLILIFLLLATSLQAQWFTPNPKGLLKLNNTWTGTQTFDTANGKVTNGVVNVKSYGAKGDSITNDKQAFQLAINSGYEIYIPKGIYIIDSLIIPSGTKISGDGTGSKLILASGKTTALILNGVSNIILSDFSISGLGEDSNYTIASTIGTRTGIYIDDCSSIIMYGLTIKGFNKAGISSQASTLTYTYGINLSNCIINNSYYGLWLKEKSEYSNFTNLSMTSNHTALKLTGGNNYFSNTVGQGGVYGLYMSKGSNDSHGSITGGSFNHNYYGAMFDSVSNGQLINNVNFWYGMIKFRVSTGVKIYNSVLYIDSLIVEGGCPNSGVTNSVFRNEAIPIVKNSAVDGTIFSGNRLFSSIPNAFTGPHVDINNPLEIGKGITSLTVPYITNADSYMVLGGVGVSAIQIANPLYGPNSQIIPFADNTYNFGNSTTRWLGIYSVNNYTKNQNYRASDTTRTFGAITDSLMVKVNVNGVDYWMKLVK